MSSRFLVWEQAEADSDFQGIDYLELNLLPTPEAPTSAQLIVHLQQNSWTGTFTSASFTLSGGKRVQSLTMTLASENPVLGTVRLDIDGVGDPSPYTLTMNDGAGMPIHPFFSSASFTFSIDCERGDCRPLAERAPRLPREQPAIDLLTKDYTGFLNLSSEWIKVKNPHWADLAPASLERVLVELLSHHGDMLSYFQDRVANEAFIEDASQRYSLRQHGTLLGTSLFDGTAAETVLSFTSATSGYVPEGVEVTTAEGANDAKVIFYVTERARVIPEHSALPLAAWPAAVTATLPVGATEVLLLGSVADLLVGQRLAFVQGELGGPASSTQIVTITAVSYDALPGWVADPLASSDPTPAPVAVTIVTFDPPLEQAATPWTGLGLTVHGNLATARFGEQQTDEIELSSYACSDRQSFLTEERPGQRSLLRALRVPRRPVVYQAVTLPTGVITSTPLLDVFLGTERWTREDHLLNSQSYDRHYVATADEDGSVWIELGDGILGQAIDLVSDAELGLLVVPDKLKLVYRVGDVIAGNVGAGVLTRFVPGTATTLALGDFAVEPVVVNVLPGSNGRQAETKEAARLRIPASLRNGPLERAVTLTDYAKAALTVDGVARAVAKNIGGPFNAVLVLADPRGRATLSASVKQAVYDRIDAVRMAGREHFVSEPTYVPVEITLSICNEPGSLAHRVRDAVLAALRPGEDDAPGFFHPDELSFGEELELADVLATVQRVPGVRSVKARRFRRADVLGGELVVSRILLGPTEVIRMDGDPQIPENGKLDVYVDSLDPELTDPTYYAPYLLEESP